MVVLRRGTGACIVAVCVWEWRQRVPGSRLEAHGRFGSGDAGWVDRRHWRA